MTKRGRVVCQAMAILVALYGVLSACVCTDHVAAQGAVSPCHRCASSDSNPSTVQMASHHQCCGMERAPIALEKLLSPTPILSDVNISPQLAASLFDRTIGALLLSTSSHAPPHDLPIYLSTQRFVI